ncbi:MAG: hypothetical protein AAGJ10_00040 [Bacteroidota bacterium]
MLLVPLEAHAQLGDPIRLYGYFQGQFRYGNERATGVIAVDSEQTSFSLQQLNLLLAKDFDPSFSAFVNLEFTNTFSTQDGWGNLKVEEAWLQYRYSPALRVQLGLRIPEFNNLNTIKNRTPLLPYIARPLAYETALAGILLDTEAFAPQHSFLSASGTYPVGGVRLDYSAHLGNQEDFVTAEGSNTFPTGTDVSLAKAYGGRIGIRHRSLKAGLSGTSDTRTTDVIRVGDVERVRIGADLSFTLNRFSFEAEWTEVISILSDAQQQQLDRIQAEQTIPQVSVSLDKRFYYVTLGYYLTDTVFAYGIVSQLFDAENIRTDDGILFLSGGMTYRPIDPVVFKVQYVHGQLKANPILDYTGSYVFAAVSVLF